MVVTCQISLQKPQEGFYRPGNSIMGKVKFNFSKAYEFASIHISLIGKGVCYWTERRGGGATQHFINKEDYVTQHNIIQESVRNGTVIYKQGDYEHPFHFILPEDLPTTFNNATSSGHISYKIILKFEKPSSSIKYKSFETEIIVRGYVTPIYSEPVVHELNKNLLTFSTNNFLNLKAGIAKTCVTPGEDINLTIFVKNNTNIRINGIKTEIYGYTTYIADSGHRNMEKEHIKETIKEVAAIEKDSETKISCVIPTLSIMYSVQYSKIIIGEYIVRITVRLPLPHKNAYVEIPVVIGDQKGFNLTDEKVPDSSLWPTVTEIMKEEKHLLKRILQ